MDLCSLCDRLIEGPRLTLETGKDCHPACIAKRVQEDAVVALIAAAILVLAPPIIVWAG
jgi:hypothetical protein